MPLAFLAYFDIRPFLFIGGLPLFIALCLVVCCSARAGFGKWQVAVFAAVIYSVLFAFFLTGVGPFVGRKQVREYLMTWEVRPVPSNGMKEAEVVLSFVGFPGYFVGEFSDILATHLRRQPGREVKVLFEVTTDHGKVRGFRGLEIAGLRDWKPEWGYSGASGSPERSPWD